VFKKLIPLAAMAAVLTIVSTHIAFAQAAPVAVKCTDGTTSTATGKGACSHHGGIAHSSTASASTTNHPPPPAPPAAPPAASATGSVPCGDGTMSTATGKGACSHHGGIAHSSAGSAATTKIVAPATGNVPPSAPTPTAAAQNQPTHQNPNGTGEHPDNNPQGATAQCKDGTYSHAKNHSGACSSHGGVAKWLDQKPAQ
jgi:hypothetical protein